MSAAHHHERIFIKSTRSANNGACVEVALDNTVVSVRDSKDQRGPVIDFDAAAWQAFIGGLHLGAFDPPS